MLFQNQFVNNDNNDKLILKIIAVYYYMQNIITKFHLAMLTVLKIFIQS